MGAFGRSSGDASQKVSELKAIREELERTRAPGDIARLLNRQLDFTQSDLAAATAAHWRTVSNWLGKEEKAPGNIEHRERLLQLKALVELVLQDGTIAADMLDWFRCPSRNLGYRNPFELIAEGRWQEVGSSLCEEIGVPKAVWPEAFRARLPTPSRQERRTKQSI